MRPRLRPLSLAALALLGPLAPLAPLAHAQVRTDGSLGAAQSLAGPTYAITESLGRRAGNNLFHSFETFRIGRGETALFSTTTPTIANVIGRVTGGQVSTIDGTIRLQAAGGAPALFLINPAGVVFGAGAQIDVPGAFHVSTADSIRFPDGQFHADPARASTFSSAPPEAFGFLGTQRAAVELRGAELSTGDAPLSIVAGDVTLREFASVRNRGGDVKVVAVGREAAQVPLQGEPAQPLRGTLRMEGNAQLLTEAEDGRAGGKLEVAAGRIEMAGSDDCSGCTMIWSRAWGGGPGGAVSVRADEVLVLAAGGVVGSSTFAADAEGGAVQVTAGRLEADGGDSGDPTGIFSVIDWDGLRSGDVTVRVAGETVLRRGAEIGSQTTSEALRVRDNNDGPMAGKVAVHTGSLRIEGEDTATGIGRLWGAQGLRSGPVEVHVAGDALLRGAGARIESADALRIAAGNLALEDGGSIYAEGFGPEGEGRNIAVQGTLAVVGADTQISLYGPAPVRVQAGRILLDAGTLMQYGATDAADPVAAGLTVTAAQALEVRNRGQIYGVNAVTLEAGSLLLDNGFITAEANDGVGGDLRISVAGRAELRHDSWLSTEATRDATQAGRIVLRAGEFTAADSRVTSRLRSLEARRTGDLDLEAAGAMRLERTTLTTGDAFRSVDIASGDIRLRAGGALVLESSDVGTFSAGAARAGDVTLEASSIRVRGVRWPDAPEAASQALVSSFNLEEGTAGDVTLRASGAIALEGDARVQSASARVGGRVEVRAASLSMEGDQEASPSLGSIAFSGQAGEVVLDIAGPVALRGGATVQSYAESAGNAGAVRIAAASLLVEGEGSAVSTGSRSGGHDAGSIDIRLAGDLVLRDQGRVSADSLGSGAAGTIRIEAQNVTVTGQGGDDPGSSSISAGAFVESSGQMGGISVTARDRILLENDGSISMASFATPADPGAVSSGVLRLAAPRIELRGGTVDTVSGGNVAGADIQVEAGRLVVADGSGILTTAALGGDGGHIRIAATDLVLVQDSFVSTTSGVSNGGNISIAAPVLALNTAYVHANAGGASGGDIRLDVAALLPGHQSLRVGGDQYTAYEPGPGANEIKAAAPTGVSGRIEIASPQLDLAGTLLLVTADTLPTEPLGKSPCRRTGGSALGIAGRGGLAPSVSDPVGAHWGAAARTQPVASVVRLAGHPGCAGS